MNQKHFKEFSGRLKERREDLDLTPKQIVDKTNLRKEWINAIESGDFDFAPEVYIKGIVRQYASQLRLKPDDVLKEYEQIREKIHFIAEERYVEIKSFDARSHFSPREIVDFLISGKKGDEQVPEGLEAEVRKKLLKERKINLAVMSAGAFLAVISMIYVFFDTSGNIQNIPAEKKNDITVAANVKTTVKRARWELSDPILNEQQRQIKIEAEQKMNKDSIDLLNHFKNITLNKDEKLEPISVDDAARDLERRISN
jgi:cytoskeletal protein RodZ